MTNFTIEKSFVLGAIDETRLERNAGIFVMIILREIIDTCKPPRITDRIPVGLPGPPFPRDLMLNSPAHFFIIPLNKQHLSP